MVFQHASLSFAVWRVFDNGARVRETDLDLIRTVVKLMTGLEDLRAPKHSITLVTAAARDHTSPDHTAPSAVSQESLLTECSSSSMHCKVPPEHASGTTGSKHRHNPAADSADSVAASAGAPYSAPPCGGGGAASFMTAHTSSAKAAATTDAADSVPAQAHSPLVDSSSTVLQVWQTPPTVEWQETELLVARVLVVLGSFCKNEEAAYTSIKQELIALLHKLVIGHLLDPALDLKTIFRYGLDPIMRLWGSFQGTLAPLNELASAILQQLAQNPELLELPTEDEKGPSTTGRAVA